MKRNQLDVPERIIILFALVMLLLMINCQISIHNQDDKLSTINSRLASLEEKYSDLQKDNHNLKTAIYTFLDKWDIAVMEATAYSPYDDRSGLNSDGNPNMTATGTKPAPGTIAVNPKTIPYGSLMWVQGYGAGKALDTGGDMRKYPQQIDVFKWTYEEAMVWGRQKVIVVWQKI